jgi:SAM-dependent methyltransferase
MRHSLASALTHPNKILKFAIRKFQENVLWDYYYRSVPETKTKAWIPHDSDAQDKIVQELQRDGYDVHPYIIDVADYRGYLERANYADFRDYYQGGRSPNFVEKSLEHYLATKFLELSKDDVYIDIANAGSPVPEIYHVLSGCTVYRQDLAFPAGMNDKVIGGDAAQMPLPDDFATKIALHCSFKHFEQGSDIGFIREAGRVLRTAGRLVILPLYLFNEYAIQTDPVVTPRGKNVLDP